MTPLIESTRPSAYQDHFARIGHTHGGLMLLSLLGLLLAALAWQLVLVVMIVGPAVRLLTLLDQPSDPTPADQQPDWSTRQERGHA